MRKLTLLLVILTGLFAARPAQAQSWEAVQRILGREGEVEDGILRITVPRTDLDVTIYGTPVSEAMAAKAWFGFWPMEDGQVMLMGDIAMPAEEVPAVEEALYREGLEMTALHNHLLGEKPRLMFLHVRGTGSAEELARGIRAALEEINLRPGTLPQ